MLDQTEMQALGLIKIVLTTFPDREQAERVSQQMVECGLVACAQVGQPVTSFYEWEGVVERATEYPVTYKVSVERERDMRERLLSLQPYDTPQIVILEAQASAEYAAWVNQRRSES